MSSDSDRLVAERHRVLQIICGAILASLGVYVAVAWVVVGQGQAGPGGAGKLSPAVAMALVGVAVTLLASAEGVARLLKQRASFGADCATRVQGFVQATIVGFALREAAGVIGLVLSFLSGNILWVAALAAAAAAAMALGWPRRSEFEALVGPGRPSPIG